MKTRPGEWVAAASAARQGAGRPRGLAALFAGLVSLAALVACAPPPEAEPAAAPPRPTAAPPHVWADWERAAIESLSIAKLGEAPLDHSNHLAEDPAAAALGHRLFFDPGLSANGEISCATCHDPARGFTDGLPFARGLGEVARGTPSLIGIAWSPWFYWDGRADSLWAQALAPMQAPAEMGSPRVDLARAILAGHGPALEAVAGALPELEDRERFPPGAGPEAEVAEGREAWRAMAATDRDAVNRVVVAAAKAIGAYERLLRPGPVALDRYVEQLAQGGSANVLTARQAQGLRLFVGRAECMHCHNGPRLTNDDFHNIGLPTLPDRPADLGRIDGLHRLLADPFTCEKGYSDADPEDCMELRYLKTEGPTLAGAFKTPTLRGVADTAPYMHDGRFGSLEQVVAHYDAAAPAELGLSELIPLTLVESERLQIVAFLRTLRAEVDADPRWLRAPQGAVQ